MVVTINCQTCCISDRFEKMMIYLWLPVCDCDCNLFELETDIDIKVGDVSLKGLCNDAAGMSFWTSLSLYLLQLGNENAMSLQGKMSMKNWNCRTWLKHADGWRWYQNLPAAVRALTISWFCMLTAVCTCRCQIVIVTELVKRDWETLNFMSMRYFATLVASWNIDEDKNAEQLTADIGGICQFLSYIILWMNQ